MINFPDNDQMTHAVNTHTQLIVNVWEEALEVCYDTASLDKGQLKQTSSISILRLLKLCATAKLLTVTRWQHLT